MNRTPYDEFEFHASNIRIIAELLLETTFGGKCPDYDKDCECCQRWKLLENLLANPFDKDDE